MAVVKEVSIDHMKTNGGPPLILSQQSAETSSKDNLGEKMEGH